MDNKYTYADARGAEIEIGEVGFRGYTLVFTNLSRFKADRTAAPGVKQATGKEPSEPFD